MELVITLIIGIALALLAKNYLFSTNLVSGRSMASTLQDGDFLFTNRLTYHLNDPKRGEIVILQLDKEKVEELGYREDMMIKRVIGLPGETVDLYNGDYYINGELLEEDYLDEGTITEVAVGNHWELGDDEYFVSGDNRSHSSDSRNYGPLHKDEIKGKSIFRLFPFDRFGKI